MATKIKSNTVTVDYEEFEGDSLIMDFTWKDSTGSIIDLTSYTACLQVKTEASSPLPLLSYTELTGITLGSGTSNIYLVIDSNDTITLGAGSFVYDIQLTEPSGLVNTLIQGSIEILESVTKC